MANLDHLFDHNLTNYHYQDYQEHGPMLLQIKEDKKYMNTSNCSDEKSYDRVLKCSTKNDEKEDPKHLKLLNLKENYAVQQSIQQPIHTDFTAPKTGTLVDNRSMEARLIL